jgi:hypothetical protein
MNEFTSFPTNDEIAYAQNLTGLSIAWAERIEKFARNAVSDLRSTAYSGEAYDAEGLRFDAAAIVTERLLLSERWANVTATDISDIASEAVYKIV